jgi:hypothetical protein
MEMHLSLEIDSIYPLGGLYPLGEEDKKTGWITRTHRRPSSGTVFWRAMEQFGNS